MRVEALLLPGHLHLQGCIVERGARLGEGSCHNSSMGGAKRLMMEYEERGYGLVEGSLCRDHLQDRYLRDTVEPSSDDEDNTCLVCGQSGDAMASLESLVKVVVAAMRVWYSDPLEELPWDGREGGFQGEVLDTEDVIRNLCDAAFTPDSSGDLHHALVDAIDLTQWTPLGGGADRDLMDYAWDVYADDVRRGSRFVFLMDVRDRYDAPTRVAKYLSQIVDSYVTAPDDLVTRTQDVSVFRGRLVEDPTQFEATAKQLGPAPSELAAANRMSAPGISLMYASADPQTAIAEIAGHGVEPFAITGRFENVRTLFILDLTKRPERSNAGSLFDPGNWDRLRMIMFFDGFVERITRPVIPDGRQHIEYTPTQVLTEFLRWTSPHPLDGIALPSAQTGEKTYVFFCGPEGIVDHETDRIGAMFRFVPNATQVYRVERSYHGELSSIRTKRPSTRSSMEQSPDTRPAT